MALNKQAKILTKSQEATVLAFLSTTRYPLRNKVLFLLSTKAGLRAKEISTVTWGMVTDSEGNISDVINLENVAAKGKSGGVIPLNKDLKDALKDYFQSLDLSSLNYPIIQSERSQRTSAQVVVNTLCSWYIKLGFHGCSSHSGRRTFITSAARKISSVGGSIRDVQMLARHSSLQMTQRYIEANVEAQKRVVQII